MSLLQIQEPIAENNDLQIEDIVGIDLGTTNSLIGIVNENSVNLFKDDNDNDMIASIVVYDENGEFLGVGNNINGKYKISSIKRIIGKSYEDLLNIDLNNISYRDLIDFDKSNEESIYLKIANKSISAIKIYSEILIHLKKIAEKKLNKTISKAVISVPAYFDEKAKNATKESAKIAELEVLRLINEPTAGAFAYGLDNNSLGQYLIYDLGGGTFDISILKMSKGIFKVIGVSGDNHLGGDDIDTILKKNNIANPKLTKEKLTYVNEFENLTRNKFNQLISPIINKTIKITQNLIEDLDLHDSSFDGIILVGGSTKIPFIREQLAQNFPNIKIITDLDPDRVVAIGACYQANNLSHKKNNLLLDVNPLSLGIELMGGIVDKIIYRNSTVPISKSKEFTTYADNQTAIQLHIVQGEREFVKDCRSLAKFEIKNIPPMPAGLAKLKITFTLDADGLLTVNSHEKTTNQHQEITIKPTFELDDKIIKDMLLQSLKNSKEDMNQRLLTETIVDAQHDIDIITHDLIQDKILNDHQKNEIKLVVNNLQSLLNEPNKKREDIIEAQKKLAIISEPIILSKINNELANNIKGKKIDDISSLKTNNKN
jgi:molecular chaperone HscA